MFRERIIKHAERVAQILEEFPDIAKIEQNTKDFLIRPFFECLGYDPNDPGQVFSEATTDAGKKKVDYMLTGEGGVKVAVEAKSANTKLSAADIQQLREYFTFSKAVAGILTNGVQYWLFADLDTTNVMDSEPYHIVNIEDPKDLTPTDCSHLETLTRSRVRQSAIRDQARRERYRSRVNAVVKQELDSPSKGLLELIGKKAGISRSKANLEFLGPLVTEAINGHLNKEAPSEDPPKVSPATPSPEDPPADSTEVVIPPDFPRATLFGEKLSVKNYRELLTSVVAELQTRHGDGFDIRVRDESVFRGKKWWYISTELHHFGPKRNKHKVGNYWVDTNLNAKGKVRRARSFLKAFGHDPDELVVHTSDD